MTKWRCVVCGYIHVGDEPPNKCPKCGAPRSRFVKVEEETAPKTAETEGQQLEWKCSKCGYSLSASTPPETCPSCNERCEFINVTCYIPECKDSGIDHRL